MKNASWLKTLACAAALLPATLVLAAPHQSAARLPELPGTEAAPRHRGNGEIRRYVEQNILPVVRQQRQKLDAQLSAPDKAQLSTYRSQLQALRAQRRELHQSLRAAAGSNAGQRPQLSDAQRQQLEQFRTEQRGIMQQVQQLAQKYAPQIEQLKAEVQPQRDKWAADLKTLAQANLTPEQRQQVQNWKAKDAQPGHHRGHGLQKLRLFAAPRFLLLDPNAPASADAPRPAPAALYPNPANLSQRLDYDVTKAGSVKVELLDERGTTLRTLFDGKQDKGNHSLDVNLADLARGTYYYKITSKSHTETRRFAKE